MAEEIPENGGGEGPVHYQISITGRQAAAFFLLLLLALGLSFFFGMKTGAAARRGPDAIARLASVSDLPVPTAAPEEKANKPAAVPTPEMGEKKLGFEDAGPAATATPPHTPVPAPAATPAPKPTPAPTAVPKKEPAAKPAEKGFYVQVMATKDGKTADDWVKKLKKEGYKADVSPSPKNPELFRVRVGPYPDKAKAEAGKKKILKANPGAKGLMVVPA